MQYYYTCQFSSTEYKTDSLTISDQLNAQLYQSNLTSSFKVTGEYYGTTKGVLQADNYTNLILSFNNSEYEYSNYIYSLNYSLPYYALTIRADPAEIINFNNIHVDKQDNNFYFTVGDASNCKIQLNDFFNSKIFPCDLSFNEINFSIRTDKTNYFNNDTIKVYITPDDLLVNLTYGNQSITARNYTEFQAVLYENKIYATVNDQEEAVLINVNNKEDFDTLLELCALLLIGYICYRIIKVYAFKILEAT